MLELSGNGTHPYAFEHVQGFNVSDAYTPSRFFTGESMDSPAPICARAAGVPTNGIAGKIPDHSPPQTRFHRRPAPEMGVVLPSQKYRVSGCNNTEARYAITDDPTCTPTGSAGITTRCVSVA